MACYFWTDIHEYTNLENYTPNISLLDRPLSLQTLSDKKNPSSNPSLSQNLFPLPSFSLNLLSTPSFHTALTTVACITHTEHIHL